MKKKAKILDDNLNEVEIDVKSFLPYHEISLKRRIYTWRSGYYFTVNDKFRKKIKQLLDLINKKYKTPCRFEAACGLRYS